MFDYQNRPDYGKVVFDSNGGYSLGNTDGNVDPRLDFITGRPTIRYKTFEERACGLWVRNSDVYGYNNTKRFWLSPESKDAEQGWPWEPRLSTGRSYATPIFCSTRQRPS